MVKSEKFQVSTLAGAFGGDMQNLATMLAMYRVAVVTIQSTGRTFVAHLAGPENGLDQSQEKRDTKNHDQYRQYAARRADQGHVTKPGGR